MNQFNKINLQLHIIGLHLGSVKILSQIHFIRQ